MPTTTRREEVELLGKTVEYEVRRSDGATEPRIDIDIRGVVVILPTDSEMNPATLLQDNAGWVLEKRRKYQQYRAQVPDRTFAAGERFPFLGEEYELTVESRPRAVVSGGMIRLRRSAVEQSSVRRALENFYRRQARRHFTARADRFAEQMDVEYGKIDVRNQRTKWGSCSTSGTLGLNWRLMMAPPEAVDYVVVHELAHLVEPDHSDVFWSLVAEHHPEYQRWSEWLDENSVHLVFTDDDL